MGDRQQVGHQMRQHEQAAIGGHQRQRIGKQGREAHLFGNRGNRPALFLAQDDRRGDQVAQVSTGSKRGVDRLDILFQLRQGAFFLAQVEKRGGVARGDAGGDRSWFGHVNPSAVWPRFPCRLHRFRAFVGADRWPAS